MTTNSTDAKWALVAGGSGGIGRAISRRLAVDGWNVALTYRSNADAADATAADVRAAGRQSRTFAVDLRDAERAAAVIEEFTATTPLSAVVYAAGPHIPMRWISQVSPHQFSEMIDQDLKGCFNLLQPSLPHLRTQQGSVLAVVTPVLVRYTRKDILSAVPKAGIANLIRGIATEEGRFGVRANAIGVGVIEGDGMWNQLVAQGDFTEAGLAAAKAETPLGRFGSVHDIAAAAGFFLSADADWVTGQTLHVDGGFSL